MERRAQLSVGVTLLLSLLLAVHHDVHTVLTTAHIAGRDLAANLMLAEQAASHLASGDIFAFEPDLFLGITLFRYYPPGFFLLTAGIGSLTGITTAGLLLAVLSVIGLPLMVWLAIRPWGQDTAIAAAVLSLVPIYVYTPISVGYQTLSTGLVAQGFGLILVTGYMACLHHRQDGGAALMLAATIITHPFVGMVGVIYGSMCFLWRRRRSALMGLVGGVLVTSWWWLPALQTTWLLPSYSFPPAEPGIILLLFGPLALAAAYLHPRSRPLAATTGIVLAMALIDVPIIQQELRLFTQGLLLLAITAGIGGAGVARRFDGRQRSAVLLVVLLPAIGLAASGDIGQGWQGDDISDRIAVLQDIEPGRVLVETSNTSIFTSYQLSSQMVRQTDHASATSLHVDSSPSSPYLLAVEHWISRGALYNPVCRGCDTDPTPGVVAERLQDFGIDHIVTGKRLRLPGVRQDPDHDWLYHVNATRPVHPIDPVRYEGDWSQWQQRTTDALTAQDPPDLVYTGPQVSVPDRVFTESDAEVSYTVERTDDELRIDHSGNRSQAVVTDISYLPDLQADVPLFITTFNRLGVLVPPDGAVIRLSP